MCNFNFSSDDILTIIVQVVIFFVGLIISIKTVLISWNDKQTKTWQIQIVYSTSTTICMAFYIPFSAMSNANIHLADCTGIWFCRIQSFVLLYNLTIAGMNSLVASIMKYVFIVHPYKSLHWGHENIQKIFLCLYLAVAFLMAITGVATKQELPQTSRKCFGLGEQNIGFKGLFLCNLTDIGIDDSYSPTFQSMIQTFCVIRQILAFVGILNITEIFIYYSIFTKMKRYIYMMYVFLLI